MKFTDMEKRNLGTSNWQSDYYLAFTRVSLFHFSPLDNGDIANHLDKQLIISFRGMRVTWFCFISHIFAEEEVPTETINVLVRIFLSSCRKETLKSINRWGYFLQEKYLMKKEKTR